jgi:hypothetical protein
MKCLCVFKKVVDICCKAVLLSFPQKIKTVLMSPRLINTVVGRVAF